jgi:hypothetical protein
MSFNTMTIILITHFFTPVSQLQATLMYFNFQLLRLTDTIGAPEPLPELHT